jgi:Phytanoyl-CoA dioxygenase (PhyH)
MRTAKLALSDVQVEQLRADGFLVVEQITSCGEVQMLRRIFDRLFVDHRKRPVGTGRDRQSVWQFEMPVFESPLLVDTQFRANALAIARRVLGAGATQTGEQAIVKPPGARETPWHQDEAYWTPGFQYASLTVWMALDDVSVHNGCLQYIPGSHHVLHLHRLRGTIDGFPELEFVDAPRMPGVLCPVSAGGATVHLQRTAHFAGPNDSPAERHAYVMGFALPPVPLVPAKIAHAKILANDGDKVRRR